MRESYIQDCIDEISLFVTELYQDYDHEEVYNEFIDSLNIASKKSSNFQMDMLSQVISLFDKNPQLFWDLKPIIVRSGKNELCIFCTMAGVSSHIFSIGFRDDPDECEYLFLGAGNNEMIISTFSNLDYLWDMVVANVKYSSTKNSPKST